MLDYLLPSEDFNLPSVANLLLYAVTQDAQHFVPSFAILFLHPHVNVFPQFPHFIIIGFLMFIY